MLASAPPPGHVAPMLAHAAVAPQPPPAPAPAQAPPAIAQPVVPAGAVRPVAVTAPSARRPTQDEMRAGIRALLVGVADLSTVSIGEFRKRLARHLGLRKKELDDRREEVCEVITGVIGDMQAAARVVPPLPPPDWQVEEDGEKQCQVFLVTLAAILEDTASAAEITFRTLENVTREGEGCMREGNVADRGHIYPYRCS